MGKPTKTASSDIGSVGLQRGQTVADRDAGGGVWDLIRRGLGDSGDRSGSTDTSRVSQFETQTITAPGAGSVIPVPSGSWLVSIGVVGNWDDINAGFVYSLGGSDLTLNAWIAHRPSGDDASASGQLYPIPVTGGTVTPAVAVDGSGAGDVYVTVRFDPCEAP